MRTEQRLIDVGGRRNARGVELFVVGKRSNERVYFGGIARLRRCDREVASRHDRNGGGLVALHTRRVSIAVDCIRQLGRIGTIGEIATI